jgi:nanoRNase/pAp phosphatase (c-di-AMP/oligoRNAs hydrolase)
MPTEKHRLITRADFDGVVCGGLLYERDLINDIIFTEPRAMQVGEVPVREGDITANLPYVDGVHLVFDHHASEVLRVGARVNFIIDPTAPSAARVIYDYYGGAEAFPKVSPELLTAVDKADSAQFDEAEILAPDGWVLLNFILDPRTGLVGQFEITNEQLMKDMMVYCRHHTIAEILEIPDVAERVRFYWTEEEAFEEQLRRRARVCGNLVLVDFREESTIYAGNRFTIYALYRQCNISITVTAGDSTTKLSVGKSILDRSSKTNIGALMLEYGGGGHIAAGACRVPNGDVDHVLDALAARINADG